MCEAIVIVGRTDAGAREKHAEYRQYVDHEASIALLSGWTGIDFSRYALDYTLKHVQTEAMRSAVFQHRTGTPSWQPTEIDMEFR